METHLCLQVQTLLRLSQPHLCQQSRLQSEWMVTAACQPPLMDNRRQKHYTPMVFTHTRVPHHQKHQKIQKCKWGNRCKTLHRMFVLSSSSESSSPWSSTAGICRNATLHGLVLANLCKVYLGHSVDFVLLFLRKHFKSSQVKMNFCGLTLMPPWKWAEKNIWNLHLNATLHHTTLSHDLTSW